MTPAEHIRLIYGEDFPGYITLWNKQTKATLYFSSTELQALTDSIAAQALTSDVYIAIGLQTEKLSPHKRGGSDTVSCIPGFFADIDFASAKDSKKNYPLDQAEAMRILASFPHEPTLILNTGNGIHATFAFSESFVIHNKNDLERAKRASSAYQRKLGKHFRSLGREVDSVGDIARNTRVAGTKNHKTEPAKPVTLVASSPGSRKSFEELEKWSADLADPIVDRAEGKSFDYSKADHTLICGSCSWFRDEVIEGAATCDEPNWFAGASILARCKDGDTIFSSISKKHPKYTEREAEEKFKRAKEEAGPRTCKSIEHDLGHSGCATCSFHGEITSPIQLGYPDKEDEDGKKQSQIAIEHVEAAGCKFFHDEEKEAYISVPQGSGAYLNLRLHSRDARLYIQNLFYKQEDRPLATQSWREVVDTFEAKAIFDGPMHKLYLRMATVGNRIVVDLGRSDGKVIVVTPEGWTLQVCNDVHFVRSSGFKELPEPRSGSTIDIAKQEFGLDDSNWPHWLAFVLACLMPEGPFFCLFVEGEQGSGKSGHSSNIKGIIDPHVMLRLTLPKTRHDLVIQAQQHWVLSFDNVSHISWEMSDALCSLATGGGYSTRRYYTDNESRNFDAKRPFIINGIGDFADRPDLLERAIPLRLKPMLPDGRRSEREMKSRLDAILPEILGALYDIVSHALRHRDSVKVPTSVRMADAAQWLVAAEPATGLPPGTFLATLETSQTDMLVDRAINDPLTISLIKAVEHGPFEGLTGVLYAKIKADNPYEKRLPPTPSHFSNTMKRLNPAFVKMGLKVEFGEKTHKGKIIRVSFDKSQMGKASLSEQKGF
jgi:hypothetical protein